MKSPFKINLGTNVNNNIEEEDTGIGVENISEMSLLRQIYVTPRKQQNSLNKYQLFQKKMKQQLKHKIKYTNQLTYRNNGVNNTYISPNSPELLSPYKHANINHHEIRKKSYNLDQFFEKKYCMRSIKSPRPSSIDENISKLTKIKYNCNNEISDDKSIEIIEDGMSVGGGFIRGKSTSALNKSDINSRNNNINAIKIYSSNNEYQKLMNNLESIIDNKSILTRNSPRSNLLKVIDNHYLLSSAINKYISNNNREISSINKNKYALDKLNHLRNDKFGLSSSEYNKYSKKHKFNIIKNGIEKEFNLATAAVPGNTNNNKIYVSKSKLIDNVNINKNNDIQLQANHIHNNDTKQDRNHIRSHSHSNNMPKVRGNTPGYGNYLHHTYNILFDCEPNFNEILYKNQQMTNNIKDKAHSPLRNKNNFKDLQFMMKKSNFTNRINKKDFDDTYRSSADDKLEVSIKNNKKKHSMMYDPLPKISVGRSPSICKNQGMSRSASLVESMITPEKYEKFSLKNKDEDSYRKSRSKEEGNSFDQKLNNFSNKQSPITQQSKRLNDDNHFHEIHYEPFALYPKTFNMNGIISGINPDLSMTIEALPYSNIKKRSSEMKIKPMQKALMKQDELMGNLVTNDIDSLQGWESYTKNDSSSFLEN